jgi:NAD+ synthase (glutamine-hydrolysing)
MKVASSPRVILCEPFDTRFGRVGMLICEDFWHASLPYLLWLDGADILLFASASPGRGLTQSPRLSSAGWVEHTNRAYAGCLPIL